MTTWTHADAPELHPMWETEVNIERGMMRSGADKVREAVIAAEKRGQMTRTSVVRGLLTDWLPGMAQGFKATLRDIEKSKGGPKPIAYALMKDMDPYAACLVTMREVLNGIGIKKPKLVRLATLIGVDLEHEQQVRAWESSASKQDRDAFYAQKLKMDREDATDTHRRRVNINLFNKMMADGSFGFGWNPWTQEQQFRAGWFMVDLLIRVTGWFELRPDPEHQHRAAAHNSPQYVLAPKEGLLSWVASAFDHAEVSSPDYKPTVMPPRRWDGTKQGGYWTPYVRAPRLIRFKASQESQKERAADEYESLDMPEVYDAIHLLQETPWKVNRRVLEVALKVWPMGGGLAKLPELNELPLPTRTPRMIERRAFEQSFREQHGAGVMLPELDDKTLEELRRWKKQATQIHKRNNQRVSTGRSTRNTIIIAQEFVDYPAIYFPHMLDFRGRIYPIANFLQPQGNDIARGLLTFADGYAITEENGGAGWLAIQLATSWGNDKVSMLERIQWVEENEVMWRLIAEDPLENRQWMNADKPFQTLAAAFEWVDFLNTGFGFYSTLPVMVDGTCNGIQHLSAIMRDEVAGNYVNLVPGPKPKDIYKFVATNLQETLERIERAGGTEGSKATYWLTICNRDIPRTLTKRQVMVLPYGGKMDAFFKYTREWLDEADPESDAMDEDDREKRNARIVFLSKHMMDAVKSNVKSAMVCMEWLQNCAKAVAIANQPIYWTTPAGFTVRHFYGTDRSVRHELFLDGTRVQVTRTEKTAKLSTKEQTQGIAPNFIHSLDAACLKVCLKLCRAAGIDAFSSVHDAYGTHAANMNALSQFLREAFVEIHEHDVLGEFRAACQRVLVDALVVTQGLDPLEASEKADEMLPPVPELGDLDIYEVLASEYFFA